MITRSKLIVPLTATAALATLTVGAIRQGTATDANASSTHRARQIRVAPDVSLNVVERGDPGGTPVVLLHGVSDSWASFSRLSEFMPHHFRLIAIDMRGHGQSSKPSRAYTMPLMAGDVNAVLDSLNLEHVYVVGHSMGSLIAQHVVAQRPNRVDGLVLIGAARGGAYIPGLEQYQAAFAQFADDDQPVSSEFAREFQLSTLHVPVPPAFLDSAVAASLKLPVRVWKSLFNAFVADSGARPDRAVRTMVLWGDKETIMPREEQTELVAQYDAEFVQLDGMGHAPHWERPEAVAPLLVKFVTPTRARE